MPQSYTNKPRSCDGCQAPISLPRHIRTLRCPRCRKIYAHSRDVTQRALRYEKLKPKGYGRRARPRGAIAIRSRRVGRTAGPMPRACARAGHDGTDPKRAALSRRVLDRGVRAAAPRTGLVLASLAAMAPPRRPASVALPTVHRRRAVALLNALSRFPRWRADQARGC